MWDGDIGAMPVVDSLGNPTGVITDRDIAMAAYTQGRPLSQITVRTAMSREIHTVGQNDTVNHAQVTMQHHHIRRLPVIDPKGQVVGIVTITDLARCVRSTSKTGLTAPDVVYTLCTISAPRSEAPRVEVPRSVAAQ
jgi:CBS-domain-containing membrane protein